MTHCNGQFQELQDRLECLVWVTTHELAHIQQVIERTRTRRSGNLGGSEIATEWHATPVLVKFRSEREQLLSKWNQEPVMALRAAARAAIPLIEKRAAKAKSDLIKWQRKFRLAQTKVRKLRVRVAYYDRKQQAQSALEKQGTGSGLR